MKIKTTLNITEKNEPFGGWACNCNFLEITDKNNNILAEICEDMGTIIFPLKKGYFQRSYANRPIPITLLEITDNFIVIQIHNKYDTVKKLWYQ